MATRKDDMRNLLNSFDLLTESNIPGQQMIGFENNQFTSPAQDIIRAFRGSKVLNIHSEPLNLDQWYKTMVSATPGGYNDFVPGPVYDWFLTNLGPASEELIVYACRENSVAMYIDLSSQPYMQGQKLTEIIAMGDKNPDAGYEGPIMAMKPQPDELSIVGNKIRLWWD